MEKVAVITGAASGIGWATTVQLLRDGWTVWAIDHNERGLKNAGKLLADVSERFHPIVCDLTVARSIEDAFRRIASSRPTIDALICSAGVCHAGKMEDVSIDHYDRMLAVNLRAPWLCVRAALPMLRSGARPRDPARIVFVSSVAGMRPRAGNGLYSTTKIALDAMTGVLAAELGPSGITVNAVAPGSTDTPMLKDAFPPAIDYVASGISPLGRIAEADDVADVIRTLLGRDMSYVNGVVIPVDGGTRAAYNPAAYEARHP